MKIKSTYKFYLRTMMISAAMYYGITVAIMLSGEAFIKIAASGNDDVTFSNSTTIGSPIFAFVWGILIFTTYIKFMLQNGVSRKTMFCTGVLSIFSLSTIMGILDMILALLFNKIRSGSQSSEVSLFSMIYKNEMPVSQFTFGDIVSNVLWTFALTIFLGFLGTLIGLVFYRLSKLGKIIVGVGLGGGILILLPVIEATMTKGAIVKAIGRFFLFVFGLQDTSGPNPYIWVISSLVICVVLITLSFLLVRRAAPQKA
ncbi:hypothetical protein [Scatolibacter rhodanostii]|uniref:hypothetical protein n=1 Tax=Scatolibacter rhodanostii TaxID=2014781 RepID=UPI000C074713|nr:hypothetical protein [Scatolibacter rhodanostii]